MLKIYPVEVSQELKDTYALNGASQFQAVKLLDERGGLINIILFCLTPYGDFSTYLSLTQRDMVKFLPVLESKPKETVEILPQSLLATIGDKPKSITIEF